MSGPERHAVPSNAPRAAISAAALFLPVGLPVVVTPAVVLHARRLHVVVSTACLLQIHVLPAGALHAAGILEIFPRLPNLVDDLVLDTSDTCCTDRLAFRTRCLPSSGTVLNNEDRQDSDGRCIG